MRFVDTSVDFGPVERRLGYCPQGSKRVTRTDDAPIELNFKEIRPPRMDDSGRTKYPVLFRV